MSGYAAGSMDGRLLRCAFVVDSGDRTVDAVLRESLKQAKARFAELTERDGYELDQQSILCETDLNEAQDEPLLLKNVLVRYSAMAYPAGHVPA